MEFPYYLQVLRVSSEYLLDQNKVNVLGPFGDIGFVGYLKEAAIACFNAFNKADADNQRVFFEKLIKEMINYAVIEWDWPREEAEQRIGRILKGQSTLYEDPEGGE